MKQLLTEGKFDTRMYPSDWRYSAAIVGLIKYFNKYDIEYKQTKHYIEYNQADIIEEKYFDFACEYYQENMKYKKILAFLEGKESFTSDEIKTGKNIIKDCTSTYMKTILSGLDFDGTNARDIIDAIKANERNIQKITFNNAKNLYANFCNANSTSNPDAIKVFSDEKPQNTSCRLLGYYTDIGKKKKSVSYNFNADTYDSYDENEFAFVPFAFSLGTRPIFVNNNFSIPALIEINNKVQALNEEKKPTSLENLIKIYKEASKEELTNFNVEIIVKYNPKYTEPEKGYFKTFILNERAVNVFQNAKMLPFLYSYKEDITEEVSITFFDIFDKIINGVRVDDMILRNIKKRYGNANYPPSLAKIKALIEINYYLYGGKDMDKQQKSAYGAAREVATVLGKKNALNKIATYRNALTNAMAINNQKKVFDTLTKISIYTGVNISFIYTLIENFEDNKNLVYTFIMALENDNYEKNTENNN